VNVTALNKKHREHGARLVEFGGWEMPLQYEGIVAEHKLVRERAGLFDLQHMGRLRLTGPDRARALDAFLTNDVPATKKGRARYAVICQEDGNAIDDCIYYVLAESILLVARIAEAEPRHLARIMQTIRSARPGMPVYAGALGVELADSFRRTQASLLRILGVFSLTAILLSAVGVYGVAAHATRRRRREIGVRMALGADRRRILRSVLSRGLLRAAPGIPFGIVLSAAIARGLSSALVGVRPLDPLTLGLVCMAVLAVVATALLMPARAASATDPAQATRAD